MGDAAVVVDNARHTSECKAHLPSEQNFEMHKHSCSFIKLNKNVHGMIKVNNSWLCGEMFHMTLGTAKKRGGGGKHS